MSHRAPVARLQFGLVLCLPDRLQPPRAQPVSLRWRGRFQTDALPFPEMWGWTVVSDPVPVVVPNDCGRSVTRRPAFQ